VPDTKFLDAGGEVFVFGECLDRLFDGGSRLFHNNPKGFVVL